MKKILALLTALALLLSMAAGGALAEDWTDYTCAEESFSLRVPDGAAVTYEEGTGLMIYTEHAGKIPYAIVSRRPMNMKFTNPGGYLNNVYREHLEEKYGSDFLGMNPASMMEVGGKQLPGGIYGNAASGASRTNYAAHFPHNGVIYVRQLGTQIIFR